MKTRHIAAFIYRSWCLTRRNFMWFLAWGIYQASLGASVVLIGRALDNAALTICLLVGAITWTHLNTLLEDIAHNVTFERWEDTLEMTFSAPVDRLTHLIGVGLYASVRALVQTIFVLFVLSALIGLPLTLATFAQLVVVMVIASLAFFGLGMMVSVFPLISPENGPQGAAIFQGILMLISGVNYPISVLPAWIQPFSWLSPATYALEASRKIAGVEMLTKGIHMIQPASLWEVLPQIGALLMMAMILIPLGITIFSQAERWRRGEALLKEAAKIIGGKGFQA